MAALRANGQRKRTAAAPTRPPDLLLGLTYWPLLEVAQPEKHRARSPIIAQVIQKPKTFCIFASLNPVS